LCAYVIVFYLITVLMLTIPALRSDDDELLG